MARRPRVMVEGGLYHVYNRVSSGEPIFGDPEEAREFVEIARDIKKRDGWTVLAWCVMSNHYHMVIRVSSIPLWRGMHGLQNRFSRGFNRRHGRTGGVWQGRYKAKYVEDQSHLDELVLYVHLNPVKAGLVKDAADYVFGGHREVKRRYRAPLVDIDELLISFGETKREARRNYLGAIRSATDPNGGDVEPSWHPFVVQKDEPLEVKIEAAYVDAVGRSTGLERPGIDAAEFLNRACTMAGTDVKVLASRARDRKTAEERRLVTTLGVERWRQKGTAIAIVLRKNPDVVSWWVGEGIRRRMEDDEFAARLDELDENLSIDLARGE